MSGLMLSPAEQERHAVLNAIGKAFLAAHDQLSPVRAGATAFHPEVAP